MPKKKARKHLIRVPLRVLLIAVALLAFSFIITAFLSKELHEAELALQNAHKGDYETVGYELLIEIFKTVFIGAFVAIGIDVYLKQVEAANEEKEALEKSGIKNLYPAREAVRDEVRQLIDAKKVKTIYIMGISLREFLTKQGNMHSVWDKIRSQLADEHKKALAPEQRLRVRLLLLDPASGEGYFRYKVEEEDPMAVGNPVDIYNGLQEIKHTLQIYEGKEQEFFQARLYEHCPFSFMFLTETGVFVEQYFYKVSGGVEAPLPIIEYSQDSLQYKMLKESLEAVWKHANAEPTQIGTAVPVEEAKIRNIYRADKRAEQGRHQVERVKKNANPTVDILSITGGFYVNDYQAVRALRNFASQNVDKGRGGTVRFALLNPVCQQAILRSVADGCTTEDIGRVLSTYDWKTHQDSKLFTRVRETIAELLDWLKKGHTVELRLYSCSTASALLITSESAFVGQYIYGRSRSLQAENRLQSEYPMIEYARGSSAEGDGVEIEILDSSFKIIWEHYSITYEVYARRDQREEFNKNLARLREELGLLNGSPTQ